MPLERGNDRVIRITSIDDLKKHEPSKTEEALQNIKGRSYSDMRFEAMDRIFSTKGLQEMGFGAKTIKAIESRGALAFYKAKARATLGSGLIGDRNPLHLSNVQAFNEGIASYHRNIQRMTMTNETNHIVNCRKARLCRDLRHPINCPGIGYNPGEVMLDGEENPHVQALALDCLRVLAEHFDRSFYERQTKESIVIPTDLVTPQMPVDLYGRPNPNYNVQTKGGFNRWGRRGQPPPPDVQSPESPGDEE